MQGYDRHHCIQQPGCDSLNVAGLFGIGGGVFVGPLLVEMQVLPQVAFATTAVLVLFASAAAVLKFSIQSSILYSSYTCLLFLMGLVLTFVAQKLIMGESNLLNRKYCGSATTNHINNTLKLVKGRVCADCRANADHCTCPCPHLYSRC